MTSLCQRCALRLQRAAEASTRVPSRRTLSSTTTQRAKGGLPNFVPTSQPELDDILLSLRDKHLVPAALSRSERNLIFKPKNKQLLEDNPQVVTIGGEDIQLQWIDRTHDIISHRDLVPDAVNLMGKGEKRDWNNLPALLVGLHKAKLTPDDRMMGKIIRLATNSGRYGTILQCLHQAPNTGMTMQKEEVLAGVIYGLHHLAQHDGWSEASTSKAIRDANEVAMMLEDEDHGTGKFIRDNDPRRRPEVIGVFLELAAVYAWKFQGGKDVDGKVAAYAERLLSNISKAEQPATTEPAATGPQYEILRGVPIWHGLQLARYILGPKTPQASLAKRVVQNYEAGLSTIVEKLARKSKKRRMPGSYAGQALMVWRDCLRP